MLHQVLLLLALMCLCPYSCCQVLNLWGKLELVAIPIDLKEIGRIKSKCFNGFGFPSCRPVYQALPWIKAENLDYYNTLGDLYGSQYCVKCCGKQENHVDVWDLYCDADTVTARESNLYGMELRLAANQFSGDSTIIRCPLTRSICNYDASGEFIDCPNQATDTKFLVGYTITIQVNKIDRYFQYWRGVHSCQIAAEESTTRLQSGDRFRETLILEHYSDLSDVFDFAKLGMVLCIIYSICYGVLFYFRRRRCCYCQNKLVFSDEMCHRCKFVGADAPDPVMIAVLTSKGDALQGDIPEVFPGSERAVQWYRDTRERIIVKMKTWKLQRAMRKAAVAKASQIVPSLSLSPALEDSAKAKAQAQAQAQAAKTKPSSSKANTVRALDDATAVTSLGGDDEMSLGTYGEALNEGLTGKEQAEAAAAAELKLKEEMAEAEAIANQPLLDFFPFHWKWPKWATKKLGWLGITNKKKEKVPYVNPNIIKVPKHVIYEALGHHAPPKPDAEFIKKRREIFEERLGYVPDDLLAVDEALDGEGEHKDGTAGLDMAIKQKPKVLTSGITPFWQIQAPVTRRRPPPKEEPQGIFGRFLALFEKSDLQKIRGAFHKQRNKRDLPPCKMVLITTTCICCLLGTFAGAFIYMMDIDVAYYLGV